MRKPRNGERGFTLIELMVLLAVSGILAVVAIGGYVVSSRPSRLLQEGPIGGGVRTIGQPYDPYMDEAALPTEQTPAPSPAASMAPSWVDVNRLPFDPENITWHFPSPSPRPTETSAPQTTVPRATKSPSSSPTTSGATSTPVPTQETVPPGVEPPHVGPPDSG